MTLTTQPEDILNFWFEESDPEQHFNGGEALIKKFGTLSRNYRAAKRCELYMEKTVQDAWLKLSCWITFQEMFTAMM